MSDSPALRPPPSALRALLTSEAGSALVLIGCAAAALIIANSPLGPAYFATMESHVGPLSVLHWVNDALMALFFLMIGLEIKREFLDGELGSWPRRVLPGVAAPRPPRDWHHGRAVDDGPTRPRWPAAPPGCGPSRVRTPDVDSPLQQG